MFEQKSISRKNNSVSKTDYSSSLTSYSFHNITHVLTYEIHRITLLRTFVQSNSDRLIKHQTLQQHDI